MLTIIQRYIFTSWMLLPSLFHSEVDCNTLNFLIFKGNVQIGTLNTRKWCEDNRITYSLTSNVDINILFTYKVVDSITDVFEYGGLKSSAHMRYINGLLKSKNTLVKKDDTYVIVDAGQSVKQLCNTISASILSMYFTEPISDQLIYSQSFCQLVPLKKTGAHTYLIELPNGSIACYSYRQGKLTVVESRTKWGVVKFVKQN